MLRYPFGFEILLALLIPAVLLPYILRLRLHIGGSSVLLPLLCTTPLVCFVILGPYFFPQFLVFDGGSGANANRPQETQQSLVEQLRWLYALRSRADECFESELTGSNEKGRTQTFMEEQDIAFNRQIADLESRLGRKLAHGSSDIVITAYRQSNGGDFDVGVVPQFTKPDATIVWFVKEQLGRKRWNSAGRRNPSH